MSIFFYRRVCEYEKIKEYEYKNEKYEKIKKKNIFGGGLAESATLYAKKMHFDFFFLISYCGEG